MQVPQNEEENKPFEAQTAFLYKVLWRIINTN